MAGFFVQRFYHDNQLVESLCYLYDRGQKHLETILTKAMNLVITLIRMNDLIVRSSISHVVGLKLFELKFYAS